MNGDQLGQVVDVLESVLGESLVGAYLHGSAVLGGLRRTSDLDVLAVSARRLTHEEKRALGDRLLAISLRPRPVELTVVAQPEIRPWRHPANMELQYGDWLRSEFERGEVDPPPGTNPDLAILIAIARRGDRPVAGPPAAEVFDPVPQADVLDAMGRAVPELFPGLEDDTRNSVLTLARIWHTFGTGDIAAKDVAADGCWSAFQPSIARCSAGRARSTWARRRSAGTTCAARCFPTPTTSPARSRSCASSVERQRRGTRRR